MVPTLLSEVKLSPVIHMLELQNFFGFLWCHKNMVHNPFQLLPSALPEISFVLSVFVFNAVFRSLKRHNVKFFIKEGGFLYMLWLQGDF